jgi:hypothetical protein
VLVVRDRALRRTVALKRTLAGAEASEEERAAFLAEAQITAQLDHPSIVSVHGFETDPSGAMAYTMQLVHGRTLEQVIAEAREAGRDKAPGARSAVDRALDERLRILLSMCDAIAYAHEQGVVHRDLKPENVMVARHGEVLVMDWGIAQLVPPERGTERLRVLGTPAYMSPEQAFGAPLALEPASDQYALGLILAELITLERANPGADPMECIRLARDGVVRPLVPPPGVPRIRPELRAIVARATARKPSRRYPSVDALAEDLRRFLRDEEVEAEPDRGLRRLERWVSHNREKALLIGLGLVGLVVLTGSGLTALGEARLAAAERAAEEREEALRELAAITARQVRNLDAQLYVYEAVVAGITYAAEEALLRPPPSPRPIFGLDPDGVPPDLEPSAHYDAGISVSSLDVAIAAGVPREAVADRAAQLATLTPTLRAGLVRGSGASSTDDMAPTLAKVRSGGLPIVWTYVATQDGVIASYPGTDKGYEDDYDPRTMGWYGIAKGASGPMWNTLDADESDMGLLLTVSQGLYDPAGTQLGVAAVDVAFPFVIDTFLDAPELQDTVEAFLVDAKGMTVVRSSLGEQAFTTREYTQKPFPYVDSLPRGAAARTSGWRKVVDGDRTLQILWEPLDAVDWMYVIVGDRDALFAKAAGLVLRSP